MLFISWLTTLNFAGIGGVSGSDFESYVQSLCGGLILAAVGSELFPMLENADMGGTTLGFIMGGLLIFLLAAQDELFDDDEDGARKDRSGSVSSQNNELRVLNPGKGSDEKREYQSLDDVDPDPEIGLRLHAMAGDREDRDSMGHGSAGQSSPIASVEGSEIGDHEIHHRTQADQWIIAPETLEEQAITLSDSAETKAQVKEKLRTMYELVKAMNEKSTQLVNMTVINLTTREVKRTNSTTGSSNSLVREGAIDISSSSTSSAYSGGLLLSPSAEKLSIAAAERLADSLDEDVHRLQYFVDHCRRLMEGSAANSSAAHSNGTPASTDLISVTRSKHLERSVQDMLVSAEMILNTFEGDGLGQARIRGDGQTDVVSPEALKVIYRLLRNMDRKLNNLHSTVDRAAFRYKRRSQKMGPVPVKGSIIPVSLVIPVAVDCAMDGFLIGLSCALSHRAGVILGLVTCIEMGALGAAFGLRINKCTGSSIIMRRLTISIPPLIMLSTCFLGAQGGLEAGSYPVTMGMSIGFGVTMLLKLACVDLLGEAFRGDDTGIAGYALMFTGVWIVLLLNKVVQA
jgi:hypothetical protein